MLNVKKINYDEDWSSGCETCDYGSSYVNEIEIILEDGTHTNIKFDKMYDYVLTESDYMKLIATSDTIENFILNAIKLINQNSHGENIGWSIKFEDLSITINGEYVNIIKTLEANKIIKEEVSMY